MARKVEYYCDECQKLFGSNTHINIKSNGDIRLSYVDNHKAWMQERFPIKCSEYHFCNMICLVNFFTRKCKEAEIKVNERLGKNEKKE